jgi:hypothetical protein
VTRHSVGDTSVSRKRRGVKSSMKATREPYTPGFILSSLVWSTGVAKIPARGCPLYPQPPLSSFQSRSEYCC